MRKILKITLIIFIILIVVAVSFSVSVYLKYKSVEKQNLLPELVNSEVIPDEDITLGNTLELKYFVKSPWNKRPVESEILPGKGSQLVGEAEYFQFKTRWGYIIWEITCKVQPYLTGGIPEGKIITEFSPGIDLKKDELTLKIPFFKSTEIPNLKNQLSIAGKIEKTEQIKASKGRIYWLIIVVVVLIIILLYWFVFRKNKEKEKVLTPWALALLNLHNLSDNFKSGNLNPVKCISSLTDIVRNYLEDRFEIHAPRQTTEEFLRNMENWSSPLNNKDRNFLRDFMTSADMIKFAKHEASKEQIETAIARAEQLVDETTPTEENKNDKKVSK